MIPDLQRLETEANLWLATVRPDGRPHLVPIWFVWLNGEFHILTQPASVKARNLLVTPNACVSMEDGLRPLIAECTARPASRPYSAELAAAFKRKYDWDITPDKDYTAMFALLPVK